MVARRPEPECEQNPHVRDNLIDGSFEVQELLGSGGMACVYRVRRRGEPYPYALKLLKDRYFSEGSILQQFRDEAKYLLELRHPNIVGFYEFIVRDDYAYILMQHIEGYSLADLIKGLRASDRPFPLNEVVRILAQTARAIDFLHEKKLIHRDIKAGNILIQQPGGAVFLTDFGILTSASESVMFSAGTRAYMPPEQQQKIGVPISKQSDLYAFAIVAYEMLIGQRPFRPQEGLKGRDAERDLIRRHNEDPVPSLEARRTELPAGVDAVFEKALAKYPADRYSSAREFMEALHGLLRPQLARDLQVLDEITALDPFKLLMEKSQDKTLPSRGSSLPLEVTTGARPSTLSSAPVFTRRRDQRWLFLLLLGVVMLLIGGVGLLALSGTPPEQAPAAAALETESAPAEETSENTEEETAAAEPAPTEAEAEAEDSTAEPEASSPPATTAAPASAPTATATLPRATAAGPAAPSLPPTPLLEGLPHTVILQGGPALGLGDDLPQALAAAALEYDELFPLDVGDVAGFRVELSLTGTQRPLRYGVVYQMRDEGHYLRFTVAPAARTWRLEAVEEGQARTLESGSLPAGANPAQMVLTALDGLLRADMGPATVQVQNLPSGRGRLALWFEPAGETAPPLSRLVVSLVGETALAAAAASPTPAGLVRVEAFLLADLRAMLAAYDLATTTMDCTAYRAVYEGLQRHLQRGAELAALAQQAIDGGALIYDYCQNRAGPDGILDTVALTSDLLAWQAAYDPLAAALETGP